jgi:hypothetical protein
MPTLRSGKKTHTSQEVDTALVMLKLHKEQADKRIREEKELEEKKKESNNLRLIKNYTDQYNTLSMMVRIYQSEIDNLEAEITRLMSIISTVN